MAFVQIHAPYAPPPPGVGIPDDEAEAGARFAVRLFQRWDLTDAQAATLLGGIATRSYARWKTGAFGRMGADLRARLSLIAGIHKGLQYYATDPARRLRWLRAPNADMGARAPLDVMLDGRMHDLVDVRAYLDAIRG